MFTVSKNHKVVATFETLHELYSHYKTQFYYVNRLHLYFSHNPLDSWIDYDKLKQHCFVVANANGIFLSRDYLLGEFRKIYKVTRTKQSYHRAKRRPLWSFHRRPSTSQECAASANVGYEDGEPIWRAKRNVHNLPNTFDDLTRSTNDQRNWKRYRKTRYK